MEAAAKLPLIIVMPEGDQSFYVNHHESPKARWEDYITKEVVELADKTYRTIADRAHRGVAGLSMGGYGAMVLALRHPELFASAASHSGALGVPGAAISGEIGDRINKIYGPGDSKARQDYDLFRLAKDLAPEKRPHIYIDCGSSDFRLDSNRKLVAHLASLKVDYEYREVPGGHEFKYWKRNVRYSLARQLEAFEAASAALAAAKSAPAAVSAAPAPAPAGGTIAGTWSLLVKLGEDDREYDLRIEEDGGKLKATLISPRSGEHEVKEVSFKDGALRMEIERDIQGTTATFLYDGKLEGEKLSGKWTVKEFSEYTGEWKGERKKATSL